MDYLDFFDFLSNENTLRKVTEESVFDDSPLKDTIENNKCIPIPKFMEISRRVFFRLKNFTRKDAMLMDTYGCDSIFLRFFVNERMEEEFDIIACDFFVHEYRNIGRYHKHRYLDEGDYAEDAGKRFQNIILNLIFNAYKEGSSFAKTQLLYIYKKYYKKEYDLIKRFRNVNTRTLLELTQTQIEISDTLKMTARILVIAEMIGIQKDEDCLFLYLFLDEWNKVLDDNKPSPASISQDKRKGHYCQETEKEESDTYEDVEVVPDLNENVDNESDSVQDPGYGHQASQSPDSKSGINYNNMNYNDTNYKDTNYNDIDYNDTDYRAEVELLICDKLAENGGFSVNRNPSDVLYRPEEVSVFPRQEKSKSIPAPRRPQTGVIYPVEPTHVEEPTIHENPALLKEMDSLREKIRMLEKNEKSYRNEIVRKDRLLRKQEDSLQKYRDEHVELTALRSHVYQLTQVDVEKTGISISKMKEEIASRRIIVIGGHENWVNKLKKEFSAWTFISARISGTVNGDIIKHAEKVYFFTDAMSHGVYYRYIQTAREYVVPFGYIHDVNINRNITQIFKEMSEQ
ncbi:MAG: hypothetical protein LUF92_12625 [Clostridiales bacterium]|nr:hypothetical protein [Clostridiales bacterium]